MKLFKYIRKNFRFSAKTSATCLILASIMLWCATWQWSRYKEKLILVETYSEHATITPIDFPITISSADELSSLLHQRTKVSGTYDYSRQFIITNRKNAEGPGHLLITPLKLDNSDQYVLISRGFIPFADRQAETWEKYTFAEHITLDAVIQPTRAATIGGRNPDAGPDKPFQTIWFYPDIERIATQYPYSVITQIYLQKIGGPPSGRFPEESIRIYVPPSTHYGYTIEWIILAFFTVIIGLAIQTFPRRVRKEGIAAKSVIEPSSIQ